MKIIRTLLSKSFILLIFISLSYQVFSQSDTVSIGGLFEKNKIRSITVLDSSRIQIFLHDTLINGFDYIESEYNTETIDMIHNRQIELFGSIRVKPYYMGHGDTANIISWIMPIFFLILLWIPGILAIIYFLKSRMRIEFKVMLVAILVIIPISGLILYPLRYKLYKD